MDSCNPERAMDTPPNNHPNLRPLSVVKSLLGSCACGTTSPFHKSDGSPGSDQIVELHGIRFIGLGALTDELTPRERVYDTLEQLTTRTDRLISLGYILSKGVSSSMNQIPNDTAEVRIETVPLDVWTQSFPNDRSISKEIKRTIDLARVSAREVIGTSIHMNAEFSYSIRFSTRKSSF